MILTSGMVPFVLIMRMLIILSRIAAAPHFLVFEGFLKVEASSNGLGMIQRL
jgi:hypothetical protein